MLNPRPLDRLGSEPLVSVLMPNYNYGRFLRDAVEGVRAQTYRNVELVVCDDGSTDESRQVLKELSRQVPAITVIYKANGGQASALNAAYAAARGDIVCLLDPDDIFVPRKVEKVVQAFTGTPPAGMVYHRFQPVDPNGRRLGMPFPRGLESGWLADAALRRGGWGPGGITSVLSLRRELAQALFPLPEEFRRGFGDAYILGVAQFLTHIVGLSEALTRYRIHGANDSGTIRPDVKDVDVMAAAREDTFTHIKEFVRVSCGFDVAEQLRLEHERSFWEYLAALYIVSGKPPGGVRGYSAAAILQNLPASPRKRIWAWLFSLPPAQSKSLFQFWWGKQWWKRYTRPVTDLLRLG